VEVKELVIKGEEGRKAEMNVNRANKCKRWEGILTKVNKGRKLRKFVTDYKVLHPTTLHNQS
jgi:hypothetical protein